MDLSYAFLADQAQVENGKVYVIGGGITVLWRTDYPAPMGVTVVVSFAYHNMEAGSERGFKLQINDADGHEVAPPLEGTFSLPPRQAHVPGSVPLDAAFAINIAGNVPLIPGPGNYAIELMADGNHVRTLPFAVAVPPSPAE